MDNREPKGVRADGTHTYATLEAVGRNARQLFKLQPLQPVDSLALFEGLHNITVTLPNMTIPLESVVSELEDVEGYAMYDKGDKKIHMVASETAYRWLETEHPRGRYFFTHELGHCFLHASQLVRLAKLPTNQQAAFHRGNTPHPIYQDTEWQANNFASAFLMPAAGLALLEQSSTGLGVASIARTYWVSPEAAGYRLNRFLQRREQLL